MNAGLLCAAALLGADLDLLGPGDYTRSLKMGEQERSYLVHVPKAYDPKKPTPVVLALHGALMEGRPYDGPLFWPEQEGRR